MNNNEFLLVSQPSDQLNHYRDYFNQINVGHDWVITLTDIHKHLSKNLYHGVVVDLVSKMQADGDSKDFEQDLESYFHCSTITWDPNNNRVRCTSPKWMQQGFDAFIQEGLAHPPRRIRRFPRNEMTLNATIHFDHEERKVNTVDISDQGCFVWDNHPNITPEASVQVSFLEGDKTIRHPGKIVWIRNWGREARPCGYSICFDKPVLGLMKQMRALGL